MPKLPMRYPFFAAIVILVFGLEAFAEEKTPNLESFLYSEFKTIEKFGVINVTIDGSAEKIGLKENELTDYLRLRFKNNFAGMEFQEQKNLWETISDKEKAKKIGLIHIRVWSVGDDYPVAYHIALNSGNLTNGRQYEDAILGYGSKQNVPDSVRESISSMVDKLAINFFKARNEL